MEKGQIGMMKYELSDDKKTVTITIVKGHDKATLDIGGKACRNIDMIFVDAYPTD